MDNSSTWAIKYRPRSLAGVVGQTTAVSQIKGFIKTGQVPKTILISGPTGSGKTTLAMIIAKEINGNVDVDSNPDLYEVNVGDEGGVANIRELIQASKFLPVNKFRVMLLDEAHMLTKASASALLKPLETPGKTIWILATDQPQRLLPTLVGRSYHIKLNTPSPESITPLLKYICNKNNVHKAVADQVPKIAKISNGQPRLAIQILQAAASAASDGDVNIESVCEEVLSDGSKMAMKLILAYATNSTKSLLTTLQDIAQSNVVSCLNTSLYLMKDWIMEENRIETRNFLLGQFKDIIRRDKIVLNKDRVMDCYAKVLKTRQEFMNSSGCDIHVLMRNLVCSP